MARCDYCSTAVPADEVYQPFRHGAVNRCRDAAACEQRALMLHDPTILRAEDRPVPPPLGAPPGAACGYCGATGGLYSSGVAWMCADRAGCTQRGVEAQFLSAWTDSGPDRWIAESGGHLRLPASPPPQVVAEQAELTPAEREGLAASEALGRKRSRS